MMKIFLENVSYDEKDIVKSLGAKWHPIKKQWYIENQENLMPFANWIPSIYGFYKLNQPTKEVEKKKPRKRLNEEQWEKRRISDIKKRPKEYSFLNSDGFIQCKSHIFKLGDDIQVYHFGLWRTAKITSDGTKFLTSLGTDAVNQRIKPINNNNPQKNVTN